MVPPTHFIATNPTTNKIKGMPSAFHVEDLVLHTWHACMFPLSCALAPNASCLSWPFPLSSQSLKMRVITLPLPNSFTYCPWPTTGVLTNTKPVYSGHYYYICWCSISNHCHLLQWLHHTKHIVVNNIVPTEFAIVFYKCMAFCCELLGRAWVSPTLVWLCTFVCLLACLLSCLLVAIYR